MLERIRSLDAYQQVLSALKSDLPLPSLGLMRSARLPLLAALQQDLNIPMLLVTDRSDRALTVLEAVSYTHLTLPTIYSV